MQDNLFTELNGEHIKPVRILSNQMLLVMSGSYRVVAEQGMKIWAQKGSALCFSKAHDLTLTAQQNGHLVKVNLQDPAMPFCLHENELLAAVFFKTRHIDLSDRHPWLLDMIHSELDRINSSPLLYQSIRSLLLQLLHQTIAPECNFESGYSSRLDLDKIDSFIAHNLSHKILVDDLAALCNMSTSRFYVHFRQYLNITPHQYILNRRIERSVWLLESTNLPICQVASMSGFPSRASLNKHIGRVFDVTPCQLRMKLQSRDPLQDRSELSNDQHVKGYRLEYPMT